MKSRVQQIIRLCLATILVSVICSTGYLKYRLHEVATQADRLENTDKSPEFAAVMSRAMEATVRIKVFAQGSWAVGTGTAIAKKEDGKYVILTCGHLFTEGYSEGVIVCDIFVNGRIRSVPAKLIAFESMHDVGVIELETRADMPVMPIAKLGYQPKVGEQLFSIGCDAGEDPTIRHTVSTAVDKYGKRHGVGNIEIFGAPVGGRSGGGLFTKDGLLVGVCLASNKFENIGIYASPKSYGFILSLAGYSELAVDKDVKPEPEEVQVDNEGAEAE